MVIYEYNHKLLVFGLHHSIKPITIWAYLPYEEIGEKVLSYDPIPTVYQGCIPLRGVGISGVCSLRVRL